MGIQWKQQQVRVTWGVREYVLGHQAINTGIMQWSARASGKTRRANLKHTENPVDRAYVGIHIPNG